MIPRSSSVPRSHPQPRPAAHLLILFLALPAGSGVGMPTPASAAAKPRAASRPVVPERPAAAGVYLDETGGRHEWQVSRGHALLWEGQPYLPSGVRFRPLSLYDPGAAAWEQDRQKLDALRAAGVRDLLVEAAKGVQALPEGALARLVEALSEGGFRYGFAFNDRPAGPIRGYWMEPAVVAVKASEVAPGANSRWSVPVPAPGAESVLYALVDTVNGAPLQAGRAPVTDGRAEIAVSFRPARRIFPPGSGQLLVIPVRSFEAEGERAPPPDLWAAMPGYLDALLRATRGVSWGPGFRFFLDPVVVDAALRGEIETLLPSSSAFRIEFEAWLQRRGSAGDFTIAWGLNDRHLESLQVAARLIPLWHADEGGPEHGWFVDPETLALYRVDRRRSRFFRDLESFRVESARRAMNNAADLLKERVAGVPVLYRWTQLHPVFTNGEISGGWDGLVAPVDQHLPLAYAQCESSARTLWCWAVEEGEADAGADPGVGRPTSAPLPGATAHTPVKLAEMGMRGYFGEGAHPSSSPWGDEKALVESKPAVLFYPAERMPGLQTRRLANGVWWLPAYASGRPLILGDGLEGYQIDLPFGEEPAPTVVLWSTAGDQRATFVAPRDREVRVYTAQGDPVKARPNRGRLRLEMSALPYVMGGLEGETIFPVEATAQALAELETLIRMAEARKLNPNVLIAMKAAMADARAVFTERTAATAFDLLRGPLEMLRELLSPYIWIEGERPRESRFSGTVADPAASEGAYLLLSSAREPVGGSYVVRYLVNVSTAGLYELWLAGSTPGEGGASPLQWQILRDADERGSATPPGEPDSPSLPLAADRPSRPAAASVPYADGLAWTRLGAVRLEPGRYRLTLSVSERSGDRYLFRVDALLFAREPFRPDGIRKPTWRVTTAGAARK